MSSWYAFPVAFTRRATGMPLCLSHSAESKDEQKEEEEKKDDEETVADVIDSMSEKQQNVM